MLRKLGIDIDPELLALGVAVLRGLAITLVILFLARLLDRRLHSRLASRFNESTRALLHTIGRALIYAIALLVFLDNLGVSITPLIASLGVGSVALAFGLQDTVSNFLSGIFILLDQPMRIGDLIRLENGTEGTVRKIGWRSTHILLGSNNLMIVPNSKLSNSLVINFDLPDSESTASVDVLLAHGSDLGKAEILALAAARHAQSNAKGAAPDYQGTVRLSEFTPQGLKLSVTLRARHLNDAAQIKHEFLKDLARRYAEAGIALAKI